MRFPTLRFPILALALAPWLAASCYSPDLGDNPFRCSTDLNTPECPQDFRCESGVCVREHPTVHPDAGGGNDGGDDGMSAGLPDPNNCPDKADEPNETAAKATPLGFGHSVDWAICTGSDKDYYKITLPNLTMGMQTQVKILLKYATTANGGGNLDLFFWGGALGTETGMGTSAPLKGAADPAGKVLTTKVMTSIGKAEDTFYLKVLPSTVAGGPNFYELYVTLTQ